MNQFAMTTLLQSEGLPQAPIVLSADVSYYGNLVAERGAATGAEADPPAAGAGSTDSLIPAPGHPAPLQGGLQEW